MDNICDCIKKLNDLYDFINQTPCGFSYAKLDVLNEQKSFSKMIEERNIDEYYKQELTTFLNILFDETLNEVPFIRKIILNESTLIEIYVRYGYEICLYINNKDAHHFLPLFIKSSIDNLDLKEYKYLSYVELEKILKENMDIDYRQNKNINKFVAEPIRRYTNCYTDYRLYEDKIKNNTLNINNQTEFFIWSERDTFEREYSKITKYKMYDPNFLVRWVSKNHGDGYGFDVLSYDPVNKKQKLIEVKSSRVGNFVLTRQEFRVLNSIRNRNDVDYYLYEYFKESNNIVRFRELKYDKVNNVFVDIVTNEIHYLSPNFSFENNKITPEIVVPVESEYVYKKSL